MFINCDDTVWAMGPKLNGVTDQGWIRQIPNHPECKDYKKVMVFSKDNNFINFRMILTEEGRLFIHGDIPEDSFTLKAEGNDHDEDGPTSAKRSFKEIDINPMFEGSNKTKAPKELEKRLLKDFDLQLDSKNKANYAFITKAEGRIFVMSENVYGRIEKILNAAERDVKMKKVQKTNKCFEFKHNKNKQNEYQAEKVWMLANSEVSLIVTTKKTNSEDRESWYIKGQKAKGQILKADSIIKEVAQKEYDFYALDEQGQAMCIGALPMGADETVCDEPKEESKIQVLKFFTEKKLKAKTMDSSHYNTIVRFEATAEEESKEQPDDVFYCLPYKVPKKEGDSAAGIDILQDRSIDMAGRDTCSKDDKDNFSGDVILKMDIKLGGEKGERLDTNRIASFASTNLGTFVILTDPNNENLDADEHDQVLKYHFKDGDEWQLNKTEQEAEGQDNCFISRYEIHENEKKGVFPKVELDKALSKLQEVERADGEQVYYSKSKVLGQVQTFESSKEEIEVGDGTWALNPLIFYRLNQPVKELDQLPEIDFIACYDINRSEPSQIDILVRDKDLATKKVDDAFQNVNSGTKQVWNRLQTGFDEEMDK